MIWLLLLPVYLACGLLFTAATIWLGGWRELSRKSQYYHDKHGFASADHQFLGVVFILAWPVGFVIVTLLLLVMGVGRLSGLFVERVARERQVYFSAARQLSAGEEREQKQTLFRKAMIEVEEFLQGGTN